MTLQQQGVIDAARLTHRKILKELEKLPGLRVKVQTFTEREDGGVEAQIWIVCEVAE